MTWRFTQLQNSLCRQDQLILDLFNSKKVRYVGNDHEFAKHLDCETEAKNLVLVINRAVWISELLDLCGLHLAKPTDCFYIGINRYLILGNDTNLTANNLVELIKNYVGLQGFDTVKHSQIERDLGRQFNFVQPQTWIYGNKNTNCSH